MLMNEAQIIIQIVSEYYNIPIDVLKTGKRKIENIKAIHIMWYFCKIHTEMRYKDIAELMCRNSHCDIVHAVKSVKNQVQTNKTYRDEVYELTDRINKTLYPKTYAKNYMYYKIMSISN